MTSQKKKLIRYLKKGDITSKFLAIRNVIGKYLPLPSSPIPTNNTKKAYGTVELTFVIIILLHICHIFISTIFLETIIVELS